MKIVAVGVGMLPFCSQLLANPSDGVQLGKSAERLQVHEPYAEKPENVPSNFYDRGQSASEHPSADLVIHGKRLSGSGANAERALPSSQPEDERPVTIENSKRKETHQQLLQAVQKQWAMPVAPAALTTKTVVVQAMAPQPSDVLQQALQAITVERFDIHQLSLQETLQILSACVQRSADQHPPINFVVVDPEHRAPMIDLSVQQVSVDRIVQYLSEMTHFVVTHEANTVVFRDPNKPLPMQTQLFPIPRGSVRKLLSYTDEADSKNTEEKQLKRFFEKLGFAFNPPAGFAYDGQNILVTHNADQLQKIGVIIQQYQHCRQVSIETKFLEVQQNVLEELGLQMDHGQGNRTQVSTVHSLRNVSSLQAQSNAAMQAPTVPKGLLSDNSVGDFLNFHTIVNGYHLGVLLRALEQHTDADLMSAPKVTVLSGKQAKIVVAQEFRYPENYRDGRLEVGGQIYAGGADNIRSSGGSVMMAGVPEKFATRNIGVEMKVLPIIENDEYIHLCLEPTVTEFDGFVQYGGQNAVSYGNKLQSLNSGFYQPIFSMRKICTEVLLKDGFTLIMGGLTREEVKDTVDRIPILGHLPLFGKLFTSKGQAVQRKNLLIFVTVHLVDENNQTADARTSETAH